MDHFGLDWGISRVFDGFLKWMARPADPFDFSLLSDEESSRFIQLLPQELFYSFMLTSKPNHFKCLDSRRVAASLVKYVYETETKLWGDNEIAFRFPGKQDYLLFERKHAAFPHFFNFKCVNVWMDTEDSDDRFDDDEILPLPEESYQLRLCAIESIEDVDFVAAHYYHPGLRQVYLAATEELSVAEYVALINHLMEKMPSISWMYVSFYYHMDQESINQICGSLKLPFDFEFCSVCDQTNGFRLWFCADEGCWFYDGDKWTFKKLKERALALTREHAELIVFTTLFALFVHKMISFRRLL